MKKKLLSLCLVTVGLTLACSQERPDSSSSPSAIGSPDLGPDGSTLKVNAPTPLGPSNGGQIQGDPTITYSSVSGKFGSFPVTYEIELRNAAGQRINTPITGQTSLTVTGLAFDTVFNWKVRVFLAQDKFGPWSTTMSFRTQPGQYINGNPEILDPLHIGSSVGQLRGNIKFIPGIGVQMVDASGHIAYELPTNLQEGEYSFMATNVDEGNPGDKSKVMSMAEGYDDVTDNDYRMTLEVRGNFYPVPGAVQFRIITGDAGEHSSISDSARTFLSWTRTEWYFFKMYWRTGRAGYEIRRGSPTGPFQDFQEIGTDGHPYRPVPHVIYIGAPNTRAGLPNATHSGMIVRDLWVSNRPRPTFALPPPFSVDVPTLFSQPGK